MLLFDMYSYLFREHYKLARFFPAYIKGQPAWKKTLHHLYEEFYDALAGRDVDVIKVQYIFAYENDSACGQHPFYARVSLLINVLVHFLEVNIGGGERVRKLQ